MDCFWIKFSPEKHSFSNYLHIGGRMYDFVSWDYVSAFHVLTYYDLRKIIIPGFKRWDDRMNLTSCQL